MVFHVTPGLPCPEGSQLLLSGEASAYSDLDANEPGVQSADGTLCQGPEEPERVTVTYSIRFHDLGAPATITAPPDPREMTDIPG